MSLSGINMSGEIIAKFETDRMSDTGAQLVLKIENDEMVVEFDGEDLETVVPKLPDAEPRYMIMDIKMLNRAGVEEYRTVFILWMPMESPVRKRMLYSSTKQQVTEEKDELERNRVVEKIQKQQGINSY